MGNKWGGSPRQRWPTPPSRSAAAATATVAAVRSGQRGRYPPRPPLDPQTEPTALRGHAIKAEGAAWQGRPHSQQPAPAAARVAGARVTAPAPLLSSRRRGLWPRPPRRGGRAIHAGETATPAVGDIRCRTAATLVRPPSERGPRNGLPASLVFHH